MEIIDFVRGYWIFLFLIYCFIIAKLYFNITPILSNYYSEERIEWNEKINPEKLYIYMVLFLFASFLIWQTYQYYVDDKLIDNANYLFEIFTNFLVGTIGLVGVGVFIEKKMRTPSKKYLKTDYLFCDVENIQQNTLLADNKISKGVLNLNSSSVDKINKVNLEDFNILELEVFKDSENFRIEGNKIVFLRIGGKKKMKDRKYLLSVLDKEFRGEFSQIDKDDLKRIKEVVSFINKNFDFKCEKRPQENDYNDKNFKDWLKK